jgi:hypothetical protein
MEFMQIWEKGGYVLSLMVNDYSTGRMNIKEILKKYIKISTKTELCIYAEKSDSEILERFYNVKKGGQVFFRSRYCAADIACMVRTLVILEKFDRNIVKYVENTLSTQGNCVNKIASVLYGLTYLDARRLENKKLKSQLDAVIADGETWRQDLLANPVKALRKTEKQFRAKKFQSKRLWCALRDYIKSPEYSNYFSQALSTKTGEWWLDEFDGPKSQMAKAELPGDVWNNSGIIRNYLLGDYTGEYDQKKKSPEIVRDLYDRYIKNPNLGLYPEQFDVTFDFVPRMCEKRMCGICFFGPEGIQQICIPSETGLCSVALATCGYQIPCTNDQCDMRNNIETGKYSNYCKAPKLFHIDRRD